MRMAVNRLADLPYDRVNPRTKGRELVTGEVGQRQAWIFTAVCAVVFVGACWGLNRLCLALAPIALLWGAFYSVTKRFSWLCHFVLGSVLGLAPVAGWLAVDPHFTLPAVLFGCGVTCWVAGFDILYACQDVAFDTEQGLHSMERESSLSLDGKERAFLIEFIPLFDSAGRMDALCGMLSEITARRAAERELSVSRRRYLAMPFPGLLSSLPSAPRSNGPLPSSRPTRLTPEATGAITCNGRPRTTKLQGGTAQ